jgi:hypothetical protein
MDSSCCQNKNCLFQAYIPRNPIWQMQAYIRLGEYIMGAKPKLLDQVRNILRIRHYSLDTEKAYVAWIRRFILFHGKHHPLNMNASHLHAYASVGHGTRHRNSE